MKRCSFPKFERVVSAIGSPSVKLEKMTLDFLTVSQYIEGAELRTPLNPSINYCRDVRVVAEGPLIGPPLCRVTPVSRTLGYSLPSLVRAF